MSVKDLEPEGFTEQMRWHASRTKEWRLYAQGIQRRDIGIWLSIGGTQTMLGYGEKLDALAEAEAALEAALDKLREEISRLNVRDHK